MDTVNNTDRLHTACVLLGPESARTALARHHIHIRAGTHHTHIRTEVARNHLTLRNCHIHIIMANHQ